MALITAAAIYIAVLTTVYVERVTVVWAYEGLRYFAPDDGVQRLSWILALLPTLWLPIRLKRPSQVIYWFLYVIVYVPACVLALFTLTIDSEPLLWFLGCLMLCFLGLGLTYRLELIRRPRMRLPAHAFWIGVSAFSLSCYLLIMAASGLRPTLVGLEDVYDLRADYTSAIAGFGPLLGYAGSWQVSLINPLLIAYGLARHKPALVLVGVLAQVFMYTITGFKLALFTLPVLLLVMAALASRGRWFGLCVLAGTNLQILLGVALDAWTGGDLWTAILVNRSVALPGILTGFYFEFFTHNPQALLADSVFRPFVNYPYETGLPGLVGAAYLQGAWANANVWADAYANFGFVGLFVFTGLLAGILHVFDSVTADLGLVLPALLAASAATVLVNGALLTSLLTNGLGLLLVLLYVMPRERACP